MGTALIAKGDTVVLDKGFGYANLEKPATPEEQINAITGTYSLAPGIDLSVFVEEGKTFDPTDRSG
jgi:hypothetical protein